MLKELKRGDTVYISDFSRLSTKIYDLLSLMDDFKKNEVKLISDRENLDMSTPRGKLIITMIAAVKEFEMGLLKGCHNEENEAEEIHG